MATDMEQTDTSDEWNKVRKRLRVVVSDLSDISYHIDSRSPGWPGRTNCDHVSETVRRLQDTTNILRQLCIQMQSSGSPTGRDPGPDPISPGANVVERGDGSKEAAPHASAYKGRRVEPIELSEAFELCGHLYNVVAYVCREKGDKKTDLEKARWYIDRCLLVHHQ